MKILFVPPGVGLENTWPTREVPIGLLLLKGLAEARGHQVTIYLDPLYFPDDGVAAAEQIASQHPDFIGVSCWCHTLPAQITLARALKKKLPQVPIMFGGPQATCLGRTLLEQVPQIDFSLVGEAEIGFLKLLEALEQNQEFDEIPGCYFRNSHEIRKSSKPPERMPFDEMPLPERTNDPLAIVESARGCPCHCTFCAAHTLFPMRRLVPLPRVLADVQNALEHGATHITFTDDAFTASREHALALSQSLAELTKKREFSWSCTTRADFFDRELAESFAASNCTGVLFGVESIAPKISQEVEKHLPRKKLEQAFELCRSLHLAAHASFIFGLPGEDRETLDETLRFALWALSQGVSIHAQTLSILPGTALFRKFGPESLRYDGFTTLSRASLTPREKQEVSENPTLFSSFHYLPTEVARVELQATAQLVNLLRAFPKTAARASFELDPFLWLREWLQKGILTPDDVANQFEKAIKPLLHQAFSNLEDPAISSIYAYELAILELQSRALTPNAPAVAVKLDLPYSLEDLLSGKFVLPALAPYRYVLTLNQAGEPIAELI